MCTVTWLRRPGGYELFFSRDELRTRRPAVPPRVMLVRGVRAIAPADGDAGGTWMGANELGVTVCLLNGEGQAPAGPRPTRGAVVAALLDAPSAREAVARLARSHYADFAPFALAAIAPGEPLAVATWDGRALVTGEREDGAVPLASSSLDHSGVSAARADLLRGLRDAGRELDAELLDAFHRSHEPARGPYSVCMHREDAVTVSLSRVTVGPEAVTFRYEPGPPCGRAPATTVTLRRAAAIGGPGGVPCS